MKPIAFILTAALLCCTFSAAGTPKLSEAWKTEAVLTTCESVLYHPSEQLLYVSCINGGPTEKNGSGFIARLDLKGNIRQLKWAGGLNAPKGMALAHGSLYVSDIDQLVQIDLQTGNIIQRYPAKGAKFLNDIAAGTNGAVYVSDSSAGNGGLYRLAEGRLERWMEPSGVTRPNGLLIRGNTLYAGDGRSGQLVAINLTTRAVTPVVQTDAGIDGLKPHAAGWLTSNWQGRISLVSKEGQTTVLSDTTDRKINAADFEYLPREHLLFVPTFFDNRVVAYTVD